MNTAVDRGHGPLPAHPCPPACPSVAAGSTGAGGTDRRTAQLGGLSTAQAGCCVSLGATLGKQRDPQGSLTARCHTPPEIGHLNSI